MCGAPVETPLHQDFPTPVSEVELPDLEKSFFEDTELTETQSEWKPEPISQPEWKPEPISQPLPQATIPPIPAYVPSLPEEPKKKTTPLWLIILLALLAICLVGGCLLAVLGGAIFRIARSSDTPAEVVFPAQVTVAVTEEWIPPATTTFMPIPTEEPALTELPRFEGSEYFADGVRFTLDPALAQDINSEILPAVTGNNLPEWEWMPEVIQIFFSGYAVPGETFHQPKILVIPTAEYASLSPAAAGIIDDLRTLLQEKPAAPQDSLPFLPIWNAAQVLQANVQYLDFQNGSGVRFLTQYGQDISPINNYSLFYTFQGLTSDERFYITAILPTTNPALPDPETIQLDQAFIDNYTTYIQEMEHGLSMLPPDSFSPNLELLDRLIESISIER